ncbi:MAG: 50S ribosomal protein L21 [Clostridia bacterium]|nr:50S ribosomal protein L21 [Clostridia bacterium]MBR2052981.1 50S ribosomal protein L21 [Clostridia bacterium]MBR2220913.1 50S ribosomal protein L21 [Clostridia bacterium]MBR3790191.1 50S ribosomal protein L21 [Clostridia bacterium]
MYAIIETGGKQYDVKVGDVLQVEKIDAEVGAKITFDAIFTSADGKIATGKDAQKTKVTAEVVAHGKGEKIIVYKMIPKQMYRRKNGHRQPYTEIKIVDIK